MPASSEPNNVAPRPELEQTVPMVQLLSEDGTYTADDRFSPYLEGLDDAGKIQLYRNMVIPRRLDQEATSLQRQGQLVLWAPGQGQEAGQAGLVAALEDRDYIFPTYREHTMAHARGVDMGALMRLFRGVAHGGWDSAAHNFQIYTLVLAAQSLHATGYAMGIARDQQDWDADKLASEGTISVACFGDGASSEGDVHESMVFASSYKLPIIFFLQNNQWAISVPADTQSRFPFALRAKGYGFEGIRFDGNDALAAYAVGRYAAEQARTGNGPVLLESYTYRMGAHTTADDPTKYRTKDEEVDWSTKCPIARYEKYLRAEGLLTDEDVQKFQDEAEEAAMALREAALAAKPESMATYFDQVYAEPHALIEQEKRWHLEYQASFADEESGGSDAEGQA
ncbi:thiamine pyrophosphate-dependent enzyme [Micrococcoides hystricis]|uniref:2-oxoisovalerate dehydrogenase subunit alpha n=1 Tax=Micrococcoides hystricis TaxID=1572761 RepID=A0ABV6P7T9_9MICC